MSIPSPLRSAILTACMATTLALQHWLRTMLAIEEEFDFLHEVLHTQAHSIHIDDDEQWEATLAILNLFQSIIECIKKQRMKASAIGIWYVKPRSKEHWETFFAFSHGDDVRFEEHLRLPRACFYYVCNLVRDDLSQKVIPPQILDAVPTRSLSVEKKVAMSLHRLGVGGPIHHVAALYGVGKSTLQRVFREFINAILKHWHSFIYWPSSVHEMAAVKAGFKSKQGFSNCCGAIDVTHINMDLPQGEAHTAFFDRYHNYSITLQGIVDCDMKFRDIMVGMPGSCNDIRILRNSSFHMKAQSSTILNGEPHIQAQHRIREYIIGDGGYINLPWLVIPFTAPITQDEKEFNFRLSSSRIVVERTFGRLKTLWGYLHQTIRQPDIQFLPRVVAAACILHNICIDFDVDVLPYDNCVHGAPIRHPVRALESSPTRTALFDLLRAGFM